MMWPTQIMLFKKKHFVFKYLIKREMCPVLTILKKFLMSLNTLSNVYGYMVESKPPDCTTDSFSNSNA